MSKTVDNRVVEMEFDNKQFEANVQTSMSTLDRLKQSLNLDGASKGLDEVAAAARNCDMEPMANGVNSVQMKFSALDIVAMTVLSRITDSVINLGSKIVDLFAIEPITTGFQEYELKMGSVQTIMASTGASLETVNKYLDELNVYSDRTIYSFSDMTSSIGKFTNAGVSLDQAVLAIKGVSNEAAVSGANANEASRAMYNFAQALSAGYVKLIDWKSIENANMATVEFKQTLIDTAVEMGNIADLGEGMYQVLTENNKGSTMDDVMNATRNFNDSLQFQWMTTDVLVGALSKYADETTDLGKKAYAAAQDVKTFSMMMDTLKEAAQSGWSQTWEIVIGDFEEAKELWTEFSGIFGEMIQQSSDLRNNLLTKALTSDWKQLQSQILDTGVTTDKFRAELTEAAKKYGVDLDALIEKEGSLDKAMRSGKITKDILASTFASMSANADELAKAEGLSEEEISKNADAIRELANEAKYAGTPVNKLMDNLTRPSGRELLIDIIRIGLNDIVTIINSVKNAWKDVFPPIQSEQLYRVLDGLHRFAQNAILSIDDGEKLRRTFKGLFSVIKLVSDILGGGLKFGMELLSRLFGKFDLHILDITASIGDMLSNFVEWFEQSSIFATILDYIVDKIANVIRMIKSWYDAFMNLPQVQGAIKKFKDDFRNIFNGFSEYFSGGLEVIKEFVDRVKKLEGGFTMENIKTVLKDFYENVLGYFFNLDDKVQAVRNAITDFVSVLGANLDNVNGKIGQFGNKIKEFIGIAKSFADTVWSFLSENKGSLLAIGGGLGLIFLVKKIGDALSTLAGPFGAISDVVEGFGGMAKTLPKLVKSMANKNNAEALKALGFTLLEIAGALLLIYKIPAIQLWKAVGAIGAMTAIIAGLAFVINKINSSNISGIVNSGTILAFSGAIAILGLTVKMLGDMPAKAALKNVLIVGALGLELVGLIKLMSFKSNGVKEIMSGGGMIAMAFAIKLLADTFVALSRAKIEDAGKAVGTMTIVTLQLIALLKFAGGISAGSGVAALGVVLALKMFISVFDDIAKIDMKKVGDNLGALIVVFGLFAALLKATQYVGKDAIKGGVGILAMSGAIILIAIAIRLIAKIDPGDLAKAVAAIGTILVIFMGLIAVSEVAGQYSIRAGIMILMVAGAMTLLTAAIAILSVLDEDGLYRAEFAIGVMAGCFSLIIGMTKLAEECKSTLILIAVVFGLLAVSLAGLSIIPPDRLLAATFALSVVMGMFALVVASTKLAKKATGTLLIMLVVVAGIAAILGALEYLEVQPSIESAAAISVVLLSMSAALALIGRAGQLAPGSIKALAALTLVVAGIAVILGALAYLDVQPSIEAAAAISLLLLGMSASLTFLGQAGRTGFSAINAGIDGLIVLAAKLGTFAVAIGVLFDKVPVLQDFLNTGMDVLKDLAHGLGSVISGFIEGLVFDSLPDVGQSLSDFYTNAEPFFEGIKGVSNDSLTGMKTLAETMQILIDNNLTSGLTSWATGDVDLVEFGRQMALFATQFAIYSQRISHVDTAAVEGTTALVDSVIQFTRNVPNSGDSIASVLFGDNRIDDFGQQLATFATQFAIYSQRISHVDTAAVEGTTALIDSVIKYTKDVPNSGFSVAAFLFGDNKMDNFGQQLALFATQFAIYSQRISHVDTAAVEGTTALIDSVIKYTKEVPNSGFSVASLLFGDNKINNLGQQLAEFAPLFVDYSKNMASVNTEAVAGTETAVKSVIALASEVPTTSSSVLSTIFFGDKNIGTFGSNLVLFGDYFQQYSGYMADVDTEVVDKTTKAADSIVTLANSIGDTASGVFSDKTTLTSFGAMLTSFGSSFSTFYGNVKDISFGLVSNATSQAERLVKLAQSVEGSDFTGMSNFSGALTNLGKAGVDGFINSFSDAYDRTTAAGSEFIQRFINGITNKASALYSEITKIMSTTIKNITSYKLKFRFVAMALMSEYISGIRFMHQAAVAETQSVISDCVSKVGSKNKEFYNAGKSAMQQFGSGAKSVSVIASFTSALSSATSAMKKKYSTFKEVGKYLMDGLIAGINSKKQALVDAAKAVSKAVPDTIKGVFKERSPSKVAYEIGEFFGIGLANGIQNSETDVYKTSASLAEEAKKGLSESILQISNMLEDGINTDPVIRPVIDLSDVETKTDKINSLFSRNQALSVGTIVADTARAKLQNGEDSRPPVSNTYNYTQNNYSPKALSRIEIYRQTKNQFSAFREAVENA